jgi:hypothetical protein
MRQLKIFKGGNLISLEIKSGIFVPQREKKEKKERM